MNVVGSYLNVIPERTTHLRYGCVNMKRVSLSMLLIGIAFLLTSLFNSPTNANRKSQGKETGKL